MSHLTYTPQQFHDLTEMLGMSALAQGAHDLALSALLSAYANVAITHPCCTQECANQTFRLSMILSQRAAQHRAQEQADGANAQPAPNVH